MHGQRIGYIRVSTLDQNPDRQLEGVQVSKVFIDKASGKDTQRPQLEACARVTRWSCTAWIVWLVISMTCGAWCSSSPGGEYASSS